MRRTNEVWLEEHFGRDFSALIAELNGRPVASAGLMWFHHPPGPLNSSGLEAYILTSTRSPRLVVWRRSAAHGAPDRQARVAGAGRIWLRASDEQR